MNLSVWRPARAATRFALSSLTLSLAMALGASPAVQAQTPPQSVTVDIAAMPLGDALLQWAAQTRQRVFYAPEVVAGLRSPGLRMSGSPEQSLARLLQGTGVAYRWQGDSIILSRDGEVASLAPVTVLGARDPAVTEGTGSYTTPATASATGLSLSLRETPQSVSVVTRQRIDDQNLRSLDEVMGSVVGVQVVAEDSDRTDFWSRGFYIDNLQYDGVPTTIGLSMYGESDNDSIIYDRIEVVRGATGLMTGAGNPSASINLVRKHANSREFTGSINTGVGSWNQFRSSVDLSTPLNQEGTVRARMVALYQKKDSYIDLYHTDKKVFYGVIDADLTPSTTLSVGMDSQDKRPRGTTWGSLPVVFSDGTPTDWRRSKTTAADWTYWHTTQRTTFASLSHRFENDWEAKADWSLRKSKYDAKLLYLYGQPDRDTGEGLGGVAGLLEFVCAADLAEPAGQGAVPAAGPPPRAGAGRHAQPLQRRLLQLWPRGRDARHGLVLRVGRLVRAAQLDDDHAARHHHAPARRVRRGALVADRQPDADHRQPLCHVAIALADPRPERLAPDSLRGPGVRHQQYVFGLRQLYRHLPAPGLP